MALRAIGIGPVAVGPFQRGKDLPAKDDRAVSVRGHQLSSPNEASFTQYLRTALVAELKAANVLQPESTVVISGQLTRNNLNAAGTSYGQASLGAEFTVTREDQIIFRKPLLIDSKWDSAFMGAIAIPDAINQYTNLYRKLLEALFGDGEFKEAVRPKETPAGIAPAGHQGSSPSGSGRAVTATGRPAEKLTQ